MGITPSNPFTSHIPSHPFAQTTPLTLYTTSTGAIPTSGRWDLRVPGVEQRRMSAVMRRNYQPVPVQVRDVYVGCAGCDGGVGSGGGSTGGGNGERGCVGWPGICPCRCWRKWVRRPRVGRAGEGVGTRGLRGGYDGGDEGEDAVGVGEERQEGICHCDPSCPCRGEVCVTCGLARNECPRGQMYTRTGGTWPVKRSKVYVTSGWGGRKGRKVREADNGEEDSGDDISDEEDEDSSDETESSVEGKGYRVRFLGKGPREFAFKRDPQRKESKKTKRQLKKIQGDLRDITNHLRAQQLRERLTQHLAQQKQHPQHAQNQRLKNQGHQRFQRRHADLGRYAGDDSDEEVEEVFDFPDPVTQFPASHRRGHLASLRRQHSSARHPGMTPQQQGSRPRTARRRPAPQDGWAQPPPRRGRARRGGMAPGYGRESVDPRSRERRTRFATDSGEGRRETGAGSGYEDVGWGDAGGMDGTARGARVDARREDLYDDSYGYGAALERGGRRDVHDGYPDQSRDGWGTCADVRDEAEDLISFSDNDLDRAGQRRRAAETGYREPMAETDEEEGLI
ncbi:hypothetical protein M501DRAFT_1018681 [Patellaria atrata CBS 101060]|uniref:Uncharacterized protein n=1 Tax=Patellaria atrata CBS 101060 TaxID=1346257 RepID=A0A9P4VQS5_9PEZI|nr:hypothetical protein M501DRAFT_1018681 [Patellaria atrata CBS 101060]